MVSIGLRELQQHASKHVRAVANGVRIRVTDRGRPVAWLVPDRPGGAQRLRDAGRVRVARRSLRDLPPVPPETGRPALTDVLAQARDLER